MEISLQHLIGLSLIKNVGSVMVKQLVAYTGSPESVFKTTKGKLMKIPGVGEILANNILQADVLTEAEKILYLAERQNVEILHFYGEYYPVRLKEIFDSPVILYKKGNLNLDFGRSVGIVGTRTASEYGKNLTESLVEGLTVAQPAIVSGLAYGIDIAAHKAALKFQLPTVSVMATAVDQVYPSDHRKYADKIVEQGGALVTETPFGYLAYRQSFLNRNRIIAALSDALVVVESAKKGGSLVTAHQANNYHKEVFAVPGNIGNATASGTNDLISKNMARIYTSPQDIIECMNWDFAKIEKPIPKVNIDTTKFTNDEANVFALLRENAELHIDDLAWKSQLPVYRLANILLNLEFQGLVASLPGKKYKLA